MGIDANALFGVITVAALWGCTNPFLKKACDESSRREPGGSDGDTHMDVAAETTKSSSLASGVARGRVKGAVVWFWKTVANWRFLVPYALNQSGSLVFWMLLGTYDLSVVVPVANALTFVFTAVSGYLLGEQHRLNAYTLAGIALVVVGVGCCLHAKKAPECLHVSHSQEGMEV